MLNYAIKRVSRSKTLFIILFSGVFISTATFSTIMFGTNALLLSMVDKAYEGYPIDVEVGSFIDRWMPGELRYLEREIGQLPSVLHTEIVTRVQNREYWGPRGELSKWEVYSGIENNSRAFNGINVVSGNNTLGFNQVWIVNSSTMRPDLRLLDEFNVTFNVFVGLGTTYTRNLTLQVAGFVTVTDQAFSFLVEDPESWKNTPNRFLCITSWDLTFATEIRETYHLTLGYPLPHAFEHSIMIILDRSAVINPLDVQGSFIRLTSLENEITEIWDSPNIAIYNYLRENIDLITGNSLNHLITFIISAIPILFIALYLGVTMSDVTFNLRRREIGLLVTKGAKRSTILRIFLSESLLIGVIAGILGIGVAFVILPMILGPITIFKPVSDFSVPLMFLTLVFAVLIASLSIYSSAKHAVKIPTVEALREYSPASHPSEYSKAIVWTALMLGTYKIIMWVTGITPIAIITEIGMPSILLLILLSTWFIFDLAVSPIALLLFLYGISKLLIQGTQIIYHASGKILQRFMGGTGIIATRSIKRSPARTAAIVFLLALVIAYGFQTLAVLASNQDYVYRTNYADVGSDIAVTIFPSSNASTLLPTIENIPGVQSVTTEYWSSVVVNMVGNRVIRGINASEWSQTAYFEENWFSGVSSREAFEALKSNNRSIILQKGIAAQTSLRLGDTITVSRGLQSIPLEVKGFFGPVEFSTQETDSHRGDYSLVSFELLEQFGILEDSICQLLIRTDLQVQVNEIVAEIESYPNISTIESFQNQLAEYSQNPLLSAPGNILRIEVFFSFILASSGTIIIITASLKEKERELALMAARGSSLRQTRILLLGETVFWILFALVIGGFVGIVASYAQVTNLTALDAFTPREISILISPNLILQFLSLIILLIVFAIIPVLLASHKAQKGAEVLR
ncbi:MAG: FtsX-like permease family protein [Candidatus Hodarchaeota archaeon]